MSARAGAARPRGAPLVMVLALLGAWSGARALLWENPFAVSEVTPDLPLASLTHAATAAHALRPRAAAAALPVVEQGLRGRRANAARLNAQISAAHRALWYAALPDPLAQYPDGAGADAAVMIGTNGGAASAPFLPTRPPGVAAGGRWSLDSWAFWRQGSDAAPVSQGRVPIYGASQAGGVLQYRLAPGSRRDPRLYARAYQALVRRGESELALGASARPFGRVPVRVAGELRYTDGAFRNAVRPAAYAVTELAPMRLPYGMQLEAYGQAGWVGGVGATPFAEGQASVTRELNIIAGLTDNALRLRLGAAAWGGAQQDAQRVDIGPTMRLDMKVGRVPARVSIDWRERVGGDASPGSGLAATLSTSF